MPASLKGSPPGSPPRQSPGGSTRSRPGLPSVTRSRITRIETRRHGCLLPKAILLTKPDKEPPNMVDRSSMPPKSPYPNQTKQIENKTKHQRWRSVGRLRAEGREKNTSWSSRLSTMTLLAVGGGGSFTGQPLEPIADARCRLSLEPVAARFRLPPAGRGGSTTGAAVTTAGTADTPASTGRSSNR